VVCFVWKAFADLYKTWNEHLLWHLPHYALQSIVTTSCMALDWVIRLFVNKNYTKTLMNLVSNQIYYMYGQNRDLTGNMPCYLIKIISSSGWHKSKSRQVMIQDVRWNGFLFRLFHVPLVSAADSKQVITRWQTFLSMNGHSLQQSCCEFLKSTKFEANLIHVIDFASVQLFSVTHLGLYLARKCVTLNKLANKLWSNFPDGSRFTHHMVMKFVITWSLVLNLRTKPMVCATARQETVSTSVWDQKCIDLHIVWFQIISIDCG